MMLGRCFSIPLFTLVLLLCSSGVVSSNNHSDHQGAQKRWSHVRKSERLSGRTTRTYSSVGYYPNYVIYGRNFQPSNIVSKSLTHLMYAFADTHPTEGNVTLSDLYADQQKHFPGDSWTETGNNLYGNFKQLYLLKQARRNLKVLLSIGGYGFSQEGHFNFISKASARTNFVTTAIQILEDNGLDGIDIDFEYPTAAQKANFVSLVRELRQGLDAHASKKKDTVPYQLSLAVPAGAQNYVNFNVAALNPLVTSWNLMAYDYSGPWSTVSDYQDNLYRGKTQQGVDTDTTIKWYAKNGATKSKINLGIPLYGRAFENTAGIEKPYNGVGAGNWENGVWDVKVLPFAGAKVTEDSKTGGSYSYDAAKKELITFDTANIVKQKARYVVDNGYGGTMYWDLSSDYVGSRSLVSAANTQYGKLDQTQNHLHYPGSQFANMRSCMGACSPPTTASKTSTTTKTTHTPSPPPSPCKSLPAWDHNHSYAKNAGAKYGGFAWTATRTTHNEVPGGKNDAWKKGKAC